MSNLVVIEAEKLEELIDSAVMRAVAKVAPTSNAPEVLDLKEAAEFLRRHERVVMRLTKEAGLPVHYISSREPRFRRSELLAWVNALPTKPKEEKEEQGD